MQTAPTQAEQLPDSLVHNVEAVELNIYQLKTTLQAKFDINRDGAGWEPDPEQDDHLSLFDRHEVLKSIRDNLKSGGQDLAIHSRLEEVTQIDIVADINHNVELYVHASKPLDAKRLTELKDDLAAQLADGFGETFEQREFLEASPRHGHTDYKLGFSFDWKGLSAATPYDPATMRSLQDIEQIVDRDNIGVNAFKPRF